MPKAPTLFTRQLANAGAPPPLQKAETAVGRPAGQVQASSAAGTSKVASVADTRKVLMQHASKVRRVEDDRIAVTQPALKGVRRKQKTEKRREGRARYCER